jgi:phosphopantetheinyl transferase (holo-ACP synthase)
MLGIDIVDIARVRKIYRNYGLLFLEKMLDEQEIAALPEQENPCFFRKIGYYIASKEAIFKACSRYNLTWKEIKLGDRDAGAQVVITRPGFDKKIKLTFACGKDTVISQALMLEADESAG